MIFEITITEELVKSAKPMDCDECVITKAIGELVPCAVGPDEIDYYGKKEGELIAVATTTEEQNWLIERFDEGFDVVGEVVIVDIPASVIAYWYDGAVAAAQKIADSSCIKASV